MTVLFVAGLSRCGSSLTMRMLQAGGLGVVGKAPDWEVRDLDHKPVERSYLDAIDGRAAKLIDPLVTTVPNRMDAAIIFLTRSYDEQAKSQTKFFSQMLGVPARNRRQIRKCIAELKRDEPKSIRLLSRFPIITIPFEQIINQPDLAVTRIADFAALTMHAVLNTATMRACILRRSPHCAPDLSIEIAAIASAEKKQQ